MSLKQFQGEAIYSRSETTSSPGPGRLERLTVFHDQVQSCVVIIDNNTTEVGDAIKVLLTLVGFRIATFRSTQELPVAASFDWSHWIKQEHVERCTLHHQIGAT
jgi:hypothetical protein